MNILDTFIVSSSHDQERLYDIAFLAFQKIIPSKKGIKKAIKRGCLLVDGAPGQSGWKINTGQRLDLLADFSKIPKIYELEIPVLYEDEHVVVVNKPAGLVVSGNEYRTLYNTLGHNINKSLQPDALPYPTPCHRLDKATSGCLIVAKTKTAQIDIGNQFAQKKIQKEYVAIVHGEIEKSGNIQLPINNQAAESSYSLIEKVETTSGEFWSLVHMYPHTGRTHQLRIHFSAIGHPILGDKLYGTQGNILLHKGLFLCAKEVRFNIAGQERRISLDLPKKYSRVIRLAKN